MFAILLITFICYIGVLANFTLNMIEYVPNFTELQISLNGYNLLISLIANQIWICVHGALIATAYHHWKKPSVTQQQTKEERNNER